MEDAQLAAAVQAELVARIGSARYELWFASQARIGVADDRVRVYAASAFVRDWLQRNFTEEISACAAAALGGAASVEFAVENAAGTTNEPTAAARTSKHGRELSPARVANSRGSANPLSYVAIAERAPNAVRINSATLDRFIVGSSNEYAFRCSELTAHGRQQASPLILVSETGFGKTHLMRAIQAEYRRRHPRASAIYLTAEQFTTGFVEALRGSGLPSFRQKCRGADLLLLDDLQFFVGKQKTLEELHHTIDALMSAGRQLVLASDRNVSALRGLGQELTSRLSGGLVCEISPPDFATRLGVLCQLCAELELTIPEDVLHYVASQITAGARELRGALHRLHAVCAATEKPLTRELAESALDELVRQSTRTLRLMDVEVAVCKVLGVEAAQLRSDSKGRSQSEPRMLAMWLARKYTRAAWSEIGQYFGRRSHSTVISAHRRVEKIITSQAKSGGGSARQLEDTIHRLERALRTA
jgi:chromosomal replication initiator protein